MAHIYDEIVSELLTSKDSLNSICLRHKKNTSNVHSYLKTHRPDVLEKRNETLPYKKVAEASFTEAQKAELCLRVTQGGEPVKQVAEDSGVPLPTLYFWVRRRKEKAEPSLKEKYRAALSRIAELEGFISQITKIRESVQKAPEAGFNS